MTLPLRLETWDPSRFAALHALCIHPQVVPWLTNLPTESPESWKDRFADPSPSTGIRVAAWRGERLAGLAVISLSPVRRLQHVGSLFLAVHPDFQKEGVGHSLLKSVLDAADRWYNVVRIDIEVPSDNASALRLLHTHGFLSEGTRRNDLMRFGQKVDTVFLGRIRPGFQQDPSQIRPPPDWPPPRQNAPGEIQVRPLSPTDAPAWVRVMAHESVLWGTLQVPYTHSEFWRNRFANNPPRDLVTLVAEVGGQMAGNAGLFVSPLPRRRHTARLGMSVSTTFQGMGVGHRLMEALVECGDSWLGLHRLELEVFSDNSRAIHLYERHGFTAEGTRRMAAFRDGAYVDELIMGRVAGQPTRPSPSR